MQSGNTLLARYAHCFWQLHSFWQLDHIRPVSGAPAAMGELAMAARNFEEKMAMTVAIDKTADMEDTISGF